MSAFWKALMVGTWLALIITTLILSYRINELTDRIATLEGVSAEMVHNDGQRDRVSTSTIDLIAELQDQLEQIVLSQTVLLDVCVDNRDCEAP